MTVFAHFLFKWKMTLNSSFKIRWEVLFKKMHLFLLVMIGICCSFIFFIWTVMDWLLGRWHLFQPQQPTRKKEEWVKFEPTDHKNLCIRSSFSSLIASTLRFVRQTYDSSSPKPHPPKIERTRLQGWYALVYTNIPFI